MIYVVYMDKGVPGMSAEEEEVNIPDGTSDEEVSKICRDVLDTMIANLLDTGWYKK